MIDSKVILQKRVFSKLLDRSPEVFNSYLESTSSDVDGLLTDIESLVKNQLDSNKKYYNLIYSYKVTKTEDGKRVYDKKGFGLIPDDVNPASFNTTLRKINEKKDQVESGIKRLNQEKMVANDIEYKKIASDIESFKDRLNKINQKSIEMQKEYATTDARIKKMIDDENGVVPMKDAIKKSSQKVINAINKSKKNILSKVPSIKITESANDLSKDVNRYFNESKLNESERSLILKVIRESANELKLFSSYDTQSFPPVTFTESNLSYDEIYLQEQVEACDIIDRLMELNLSESAMNSYDFITKKSSKVSNLFEAVQIFKEFNECKNDVVNALEFLALESAYCGDISPEDCGEILAVLESETFNEEASIGNVANMIPVVGSTEGLGTVLSKTPIEDVVKSTDAEIANKEKDENGELVTEASVVPKPNVIFDKEVKAIFDKIKTNITIKDNDEEGTFRKSLNFRKNKYIFSIADSSNPKVHTDIIGILKGANFTENKNNGIVVNYTKTVGNTNMTVDYNKGDDSIVFSYVYKDSVVRESTEIDLYQEAVLKVGNYIDLFKTYESVMDSLYARDHDLARSAKCKVLLERFDDEYTKELVSEFDRIHLEKCNLNKNSICEDTSKDAELYKVYDMICEHPYMETISDTFDVLYESDVNIDDDIKSILTRLHRKGYKTLYSCSGHNGTRKKEDTYRDGIYHGKLYTTARLTFDKIYNFKDTPNGWYKSEKDGKTSFYVKPVTYDEKQGSVDEAFAKWKAIYLENLRSWSKVVPDLTEDVTESVSDLIDSFINELI